MAAKPKRKELEAVYAAYLKAMKDKDVEAFQAAAAIPDGMPAEAVKEHLAEDAEMMLEMSPDLSQTTFVDIKTLGDELAGHYCTQPDPDGGKGVNIVLTPFEKTAAGWKVQMGGSVYGFEPEADEDVQARVRELIEWSAGAEARDFSDRATAELREKGLVG